jgi:hypothetical protein
MFGNDVKINASVDCNWQSGSSHDDFPYLTGHYGTLLDETFAYNNQYVKVHFAGTGMGQYLQVEISVADYVPYWLRSTFVGTTNDVVPGSWAGVGSFTTVLNYPTWTYFTGGVNTRIGLQSWATGAGNPYGFPADWLVEVVTFDPALLGGGNFIMLPEFN